MTIHARLKAGVVIGILATTTFVAAQSKDPFVGSWTLNAAKSKFISGPPLKSGTTIIEAAGSGYKWTVNQVPVTGAAQNWSFTTNLDGKPSKLTGNNPPADMATVTRVDAMTLEVVSTINGKETTRQRIVVAADGKTRTTTTIGVDAAGQKINTVAVYEKK